MKKSLALFAACLLLVGCGKLGATGGFQHALGNWAELRLPAGCVPKQIAAEEGTGVAVLCEDGRVFH